MQAQNWGKPMRKPVWLSHVPAPFRFTGESGWAGGWGRCEVLQGIARSDLEFFPNALITPGTSVSQVREGNA